MVAILHRRRKARTANYTWVEWLAVVIPAVAWLRTYKWKSWLVVRSA